MKQISAVALTLALTTSGAIAQEGDGGTSLMEEGAKLFFRGLMEEMEPALRELEGLAEENRALAELLKEKGVDVEFQSSWDGHHWHNWRDQLRDALIWVLGPEDRKFCRGAPWRDAVDQ